MKSYQDHAYRDKFKITHQCTSCKEIKPIGGFSNGNGGVCNVCRVRKRKTDQAFVDRKNRLIYEKEIREANKEYDFLSERELKE